MTAGQLSAVVLCGGGSRRMGRDKTSLPFGPETLLERVLRLVASATPDIVLAAGAGQPVPAGFRVSRDPGADEGPLPAVLHALNEVSSEFVFLVACDTPLLDPNLIPFLAELCADHDAAVPLLAGQPVATCAVYRASSLRRAHGRFGDPRHRSLQALLDLLSVRYVPPETLRQVDPDLLSFTPCNTPEEYAAALVNAARDGAV